MNELLILYPEIKQVWQTSDGLLHLTEPEAQAQAAHLIDSTILTLIKSNANQPDAPRDPDHSGGNFYLTDSGSNDNKVRGSRTSKTRGVSRKRKGSNALE